MPAERGPTYSTNLHQEQEGRESIGINPSIADLKRNALERIIDNYQIESVQNELSYFFADKGYSPDALLYLHQQGILNPLFLNLVLRQADTASNIEVLTPLLTQNAILINMLYKPEGIYYGYPHQNRVVDESIKKSKSKKDTRREKSGVGATPLFFLQEAEDYPLEIAEIMEHVSIGIIGGGAAGILAARGLVELGCPVESITVFDPSGEYGGIWNQSNVRNGSKNNPFNIRFMDFSFDKAPGPGESVAEFLNGVVDGNAYMDELPSPLKAKVTSVIPGDLSHTVVYKLNGNEGRATFDIVINAIGNSKPLPLTNEGHIKFQLSTKEAGPRWQQRISVEKAKELEQSGKKLVFIGLGNSTAEMLIQLAELKNVHDITIPYFVLTHYPTEAVLNPQHTVIQDYEEYIVARDTSIPVLTKLAYDLPEIRSVYQEALDEGRIISNIDSISMTDSALVATTKHGLTVQFDKQSIQLYTLIGYGQDPGTLRKMGMSILDEYKGTPAVDYDGEVQKAPVSGRNRVHAGYFGLGTVIKSDTDLNATVIPGIQHRLYDQLFSIVVRATEAALRKNAIQVEPLLPRR
jgi:hypothetical protein